MRVALGGRGRAGSGLGAGLVPLDKHDTLIKKSLRKLCLYFAAVSYTHLTLPTKRIV